MGRTLPPGVIGAGPQLVLATRRPGRSAAGCCISACLSAHPRRAAPTPSPSPGCIHPGACTQHQMYSIPVVCTSQQNILTTSIFCRLYFVCELTLLRCLIPYSGTSIQYIYTLFMVFIDRRADLSICGPRGGPLRSLARGRQAAGSVPPALIDPSHRSRPLRRRNVGQRGWWDIYLEYRRCVCAAVRPSSCNSARYEYCKSIDRSVLN